jgi:branched-chain amino acid transport system permease protein
MYGFKKFFDLKIFSIVLALTIMPFILSRYYLFVLNFILIYVIVIMGYNLVLGYTGLLSLAHAAFYGLGAYSTSLFIVKFGIPLYLSIPLGGIFTAFIGSLICILVLKTYLTGIYLGMVTLAFSEFILWVFLHWEKVTGGAFGFAIDSKYVFKVLPHLKIYYLSLFCMFILTFIAINLISSKVGRALKSIRDSEEASMAMGINISLYKLLSFVLSAFYAGIGGGLYSILIRQIYPGNFGFHEGLKQFSMLIIGGQGTISGALIGAFILPFLSEVLRKFSVLQDLIYCLILVIFIIFMPEGISGLFLKVKGEFARNILKFKRS